MKAKAVSLKTVWRIDPPAYFGLPDGAKVVVPADERGRTEIQSPTLDRQSGLIVNHGTLPIFRRPEHAIKNAETVSEVRLRFQDNFLFVELEAQDLKTGLQRARVAVKSVVRHLMVQLPDFFSASLLQYEVVGQEAHRTSNPAKLLVATVYNLKQLEEQIHHSFEAAGRSDGRLDRALAYYEHARFLFKLASDQLIEDEHRDYLLASSFLFLWKSITSVLGEPGSDADYQTRFRTYGLPANYWELNIKPLKAVRDDADVAHYDLSPAGIQKAVGMYGRADRTCREVLIAYKDWLLRQR